MRLKATFLAAAAMTALQGCRQDVADTAQSTSLSSFTKAEAVDTTIGCQTRSTRLPWGRFDLRTWTPRVVQPTSPGEAVGSVYGAPFAARLVQAYGIDYGEARRTVILEMEDGCRRQYRTDSLSDDDNRLIQAELAKRPTAPDPSTYRVVYQDGLTSPELVAKGELNLHQTQHFALWYGNAKTNDYDFVRYISGQGRTTEEAIREAGEWLEQQWYINRDAIGAPMPLANSSDKRKLNVYVCGTGRPNAGGDVDGCGASASEVMNISGWGMHKGSPVLTHEFGHMIQFYTGGFQGRGEAGMIWETGAEWNANVVSPTFNSAWTYFNNLENGPLWSVSRYAAYPFMQYLYETDRTRDLVFDVWKTAVSQGAATKPTRDFVEELMRVGRKSGVYPQGLVTFADDMGWYGARLVTMDFLPRRALVDALKPTPTTHWMGHFYTPLVASPTAQGVYTPPSQRSLLQWGTHLIPLNDPSRTVKVTLTGGTQANSAAWRFSIVAVTDGEKPTYSALGKVAGLSSGTASLTIPSGAKVYLAVTATPYGYESNGWQEVGKPLKGTRFPYSVKIEGASPRTGSFERCDLESAPTAWTSNYSRNGNTDEAKPC